MEFAEVVRRRRMVRAYDPTRTVPPDLLDAVLTAARRAPSAGFTQGVSLLVLTDPGQVAAYWSATAYAETRWLAGMRTAPVLIVVWVSERAYEQRYAEPDKRRGGPADWSAPFWYVDAGMAVMSSLLAVVDAELSACFFGIPRRAVGAVRAAYGVPGDQLAVGVISVGYRAPDEQPGGSPQRRSRRPVDEVMHHERW